MKLKELDAISRIGIEYNNDKLSKLFKFFYNENVIKNLTHLSIGAMLDTTQCYKASDVVDIICKDLKLRFLTENDKCVLYRYWNKRITEISKTFESIDKLVIIAQNYGAEWSQAANKIQIPPEICLVDTIAKRQNITWNEACKLEWTQVYLMLKIDKREGYFNYLVANKQKQNKG